MKKIEKLLTLLLVLMGTIMLPSCSDDKEKDEPKPPTTIKQTTYTVTIESDAEKLAQANGLTSRFDLNMCEYNDKNEIVNIQDWDDIKDGVSTKKFTANENATKVVIRYKVYAYRNGKEVASQIMYYAIVYYLKKDSNLDINLDGKTKVSQSSPL